MNETVITWTPQNWLTVFLMVVLGSVIFGAILSAVSGMRRNGGKSD